MSIITLSVACWVRFVYNAYMPELPEVETVRMQLRHKVTGKVVESVEVFHQKTIANNDDIEAIVSGKKIADIDRIGKLMIFSFVNESDIFLLAHLKMTVQFSVNSFLLAKSGEQEQTKPPKLLFTKM